MPVRQRFICLTCAVSACFLGASLALAQPVPPPTPSGQTATPKTMKESASARRKALEEDAAQKQRRRDEWNRKALEGIEARDQKRAECRKMATEQNLRLMKRMRFIKKCMTGGLPR